MQFLMGPVLGALSGREGRRPGLLVSLATLGAYYLVMTVAPTLWLLFVGRAVAGATGATYATATAYRGRRRGGSRREVQARAAPGHRAA